MPVWRRLRSSHTTSAGCSRTRSNATEHAPGTTLRAHWSTGSTAPGRTAASARSTASRCAGGAWTARQAGQGVTAERGQGRDRPNRSRAVLQQGKAHLWCGAACHQAGGDDLGKPGAVGVRRQPVRNPGHGIFCALFPGAAGRPRKVAFDRVFRYHGLTRRHRRNAHGIGHGAKRMAGEAVHSPGKVCTWLKEDTLISRH